jgi:hypothetical protein
MYQLLEKIFGILLIGISLAIGIYLIPSLWPVLKGLRMNYLTQT